MPCYIVYKTYGHIEASDLEKVKQIAKEKGYRIVNTGNGFEFQNGNKQFGLLKTNDGRYEYRGASQVAVDEIKSTFNKQRFTTKWQAKNPGWMVREVRIGGSN